MAGAALDMSLDDLIKNNKKSDGGGRGRGRGRSSGPGPARRFNNRGANRSTPYGGPKVDYFRSDLKFDSFFKVYI